MLFKKKKKNSEVSDFLILLNTHIRKLRNLRKRSFTSSFDISCCNLKRKSDKKLTDAKS